MTDASNHDGPADLEAVLRDIAARMADLEQVAAAMANARLADAQRQADAILEQARAEARALVGAVRRSLNDALRQRDEEVLAAVGESHTRVLHLLGEKLRQAEPA